MDKKFFGTLSNGTDIHKYIIKSDKLSVSIIPYGAIIQDIFFDDKPMILNFSNLDEYIKDSSYQGALIGRNSGRISEGKLQIEGNHYLLAKNDNNKCNLHGGSEGFNKKLWHIEDIGKNFIELSYLSVDGEENFPGTVQATVRYTAQDNSLFLDYYAFTDKTTLINLTNHSYFNLSGKKQTILDHELKINAQSYIELGDDFAPKKPALTDKAFDFRATKTIGQDINFPHPQLSFAGGYDHPYLLEQATPQISLSSLESGIQMEISTDQHAVIFYTGNFLKKPFLHREGVCFETQNVSNSTNYTELSNKDTLSRPEKPYSQHTEWRFSKI